MSIAVSEMERRHRGHVCKSPEDRIWGSEEVTCFLWVGNRKQDRGEVKKNPREIIRSYVVKVFGESC